MTQETAVQRPQSASIIVPEMRSIDLAKPHWKEAWKTLAPKATEPEFIQYAQVIRATRLNPYAREIFWIPAKDGSDRPPIGVFVSHKGYWALAMRDVPAFRGFQTYGTPPLPHLYKWMDQQGVINHDRRGSLFSVTAVGHNKRLEFPIGQEALLSEWVVDTNPNWKNRKEYMLAMRAERLVLFRMYPISGAIEGTGLDEEQIIQMAPTIDGGYAPKFAGAIEKERQEVAASAPAEPQTVIQPPSAGPEPTPPPAAAQEPSAMPAPFESVERGRAEIFALFNKAQQLKERMTPGKACELAFDEPGFSPDKLRACSDLERIKGAWVRLNAHIEAGSR